MAPTEYVWLTVCPVGTLTVCEKLPLLPAVAVARSVVPLEQKSEVQFQRMATLSLGLKALAATVVCDPWAPLLGCTVSVRQGLKVTPLLTGVALFPEAFEAPL